MKHSANKAKRQIPEPQARGDELTQLRQRVAELEALRAKYPDDPLFKVGAVKLMGDGVIEAHTAAMLAPYTNKPTTGQPNFTREELRRIVTMFAMRASSSRTSNGFVT